MRPQDAAAKIVELAPLLRADLMRAKLAEYAKGGLPSGGSDGRGSAEKPLPLFGNTDRAILVARREYEQNLTHAALALEAAVRSQNSWCVPRTDDTEKAKALDDQKPGKPCSNVWCLHWCTGRKDDVLRNGRCPTCAMYYKRTGNERPRELCDVTNASSTTATSGDAA